MVYEPCHVLVIFGRDRTWPYRDVWRCGVAVLLCHAATAKTSATNGNTLLDIPYFETTGEDEFRTRGTGFAGRQNMVVGFQAPGMIYYRSDYTDVRCEHG